MEESKPTMLEVVHDQIKMHSKMLLELKLQKRWLDMCALTMNVTEKQKENEIKTDAKQRYMVFLENQLKMLGAGEEKMPDASQNTDLAA
jgi:hypothetical protein